MSSSFLDCQRKISREEKMNKKDERTARCYSPRANLATVGIKINALKLLEPLKKKVIILQKSIRHTPAQKLTDAFIAILAGAHMAWQRSTRASGATKRCSAPSAAMLAPISL